MKSRFIRALALAIVPALAAAQQGANNPREITVDDAVRLAVQNSPITVASRNGERSGEAGVTFAKSQFLPSLSLGYAASNQGGTQFIQGVPVPLSGLPWSYSRSVSTSMTIFDGGAHWYNYKAAGATLDAAVANDVSQRYGVALNVKTQYFAVLAAREQEAAARRQLEEAQQALTWPRRRCSPAPPRARTRSPPRSEWATPSSRSSTRRIRSSMRMRRSRGSSPRPSW